MFNLNTGVALRGHAYLLKTATRGRQLTQYGVSAGGFLFIFFSTDKDRVVVGSGGWTGVTRSAGHTLVTLKKSLSSHNSTDMRLTLKKRDGNAVQVFTVYS